MISNNSSSLLTLLYISPTSDDLLLCRSHHLNIPYPFAIGMDCYLEKWYEINCTTILGKDVPFLSLINKQVVNISLPSQILGRYSPMSYGSVHIRNPIISKGCSSNEEKSGSFLNLTGSPFYIGYTNILIGVGCNNNVSLTNVEPSMVGCMSSCVGTNHTLEQDYLMSSIDCNTKALMISSSGRLCRDTISLTETSRNKTSCSGFGCCKASMPDGIQQIVGVEIHSNDTATKECKVAFLTAEDYNGLEYSTVELRWFIRTMNHSFIDSLECKNIRDYNNENINMNDYTTRCVCDGDLSDVKGYRGSPYLPFGCKDIDECLEQGDYQYCGERSKCVNLQGQYDCVYTNRRPLIIGISVGFGSLIFIIGIYFSYIFIRKQRRLNQKKNFFKRNGGLLLQQQLNSSKGSVEKIKVFNSRELEKAIENFSLY